MQTLTRHGVFRIYLHRMCRAADSACLYCPCPVDDVEHTVFLCEHWGCFRAKLAAVLGRPAKPGDVRYVFCRHAKIPTDSEGGVGDICYHRERNLHQKGGEPMGSTTALACCAEADLGGSGSREKSVSEDPLYILLLYYICYSYYYCFSYLPGGGADRIVSKV